MNDRFARILEAGAVHVVQQGVNAAIEKAKARLDGQAALRDRIDALEADMAKLKRKRDH